MTALAEAAPRASRRSRSPWPGFIARRVVSFAFSMFVIVTLVFFMSHLLGGDAVRAAAGITASPAEIAARRAELGLDDPLLEQYGRFLLNLLTLNFGDSIALRTGVMDLIAARLPYTVQLALMAFVASAIVAIPLGIGVALRTEGAPSRATDTIFNGVTGFIASIPDFLIGVSLIVIFAVTLRVLPAAGGSGPAAYVLPVITISVGLVAFMARLIKSETSRVLNEDYVRTARSLRLPTWMLTIRYILPNVLTATITYAGLLLAGLLGGTIITETVFGWPGIGNLLVQSILNYDYPLLIGIVIVIATFALVITLIVDVALALVDPKSLIVRS